MNLIRTRNAQCGTVAFLTNGQQPHVPLITVPLTIEAAGEFLLVIGRFVLSDRPDGSQNYAGFPHPYFAAGGLLLTAFNPTQLVDVPLSSGVFLDEPSGEDGWLGGGTDASPMHPYTNHIRTAMYLTTAADVGQRWLTMLGWCSSSYAVAGDYLLNEQMQGSLSVLRIPAVSGAVVQEVAPPSPPPPPPPPAPPAPPPPPASPPPPPPPPASTWGWLAKLLGL